MSGKRGMQIEMESVEAKFRDGKTFYTETSGAMMQGSILTLDSLSDSPLTEQTPHLCRYEECLRFHSRAAAVSGPDPHSPESPLKNRFLYLVLIMLVAWILVYTIFSRVDLL